MNRQSLITLALGSALAAGAVHAADNPFALSKLEAGYQLAQADTKNMDGKYGAEKKAAEKKAEGKCGAEKRKDASCGADKKKEGQCGADKKKEASCGADKK